MKIKGSAVYLYVILFTFFVAAASIFLADYFYLFWICCVGILIIEIIIVAPSRNQMITFFALVLSFAFEFLLEYLFAPFSSITLAVIVEISISLLVCFLLIYKYELFGWWIKSRDVKTTLSEGLVLKYFKRFILPIDFAMLGEEQIRVWTGIDLNLMYQVYPFLKLLAAAGLFLLLFILFKSKEEPERLFK